MTVYLFSYNTQMLNEWRAKLHSIDIDDISEIDDIEGCKKLIEENSNNIILCDYDTVAHDLNLLIMNALNLAKLAVFEKNPMIQTGKNLLSHKIRAYGNSRMLSTHLRQLLSALVNNQIWTYPELTAALVKSQNTQELSSEALELIQRLNEREKETLSLVLQGYTNAAIAEDLELSVRTIKAYMHSIFEKLHVNDRLSLVLLLK